MSDLRWCAIFLSVAPVYGMIMASAALPRRHVQVQVVPAWVQYDRCIPVPTRGQAVDGSVMFRRDERIRLSQCWEDS